MFTRLAAGVSGGMVALALMAGTASASELVVPMNRIDATGVGASLGKVMLKDSAGGLLIDLALTDEVPPGLHGFHVHENGSCMPAMKDGTPVAGLAAGGHFDPHRTGKHMGPSGEGHMGDLPILYVELDEDGAKPSTHTLVAPRLKVSDVAGRSLMIHEGGDNFRDEPEALGGGGRRIACGVIPRVSVTRAE